MRLIVRLLKGLDPFLVLLTLTIVVASLLPARGVAVGLFEGLTDAAIVLLFFLHGAKLSRQAVLAGIGNWRLHLLVLAASFLLFPLLGWVLAWGARGLTTPEILSGMLYLSLLPSTVQSSIAFTAMAGGNVPAAVCSASLSNITGIVLTPLMVGLLIEVQGSAPGVSLDAIEAIMLQLLLPFVAGHLLRPWIGGFLDRHRKLLMPVDRSSILLVVYTAFSAAVVNGIWQRTEAADLLMILGLSAVLLAVVMAVNLFVARRLHLPRGDEIVLLFCGSKKSLVSGVPMAGAIFAPAQVGVIILPLMIFHQLQLFVCALVAARYARTAAVPVEA
ncbi:bile acid:sodium symporter [Sphingomonas histidinilytica]|jgi:sodium/bile acid cotransporter 7|uniref:Solute carrier family 10 (Sodium/bile acid cotransporter), member 7 n=1 Tax=Rhizorhabdus histidinilytica TaxID=439228 RepID=A0A1T5FGQ8_9SPHN|nr:bile acid:sodium symporter family protein [Rhizorhabdus histidinilytica]MBO9375646.1 bile acid:sodium symporter [Rhizorhabdus histidinilytica]QEH81088.1 bile acid:sodium symporter [Sphingomonas sp. C8-2]SKB95345.1 solute carrier family 10 (sodium/bile acid cotransporter), member 7 [Rhizorhabdus histidinilytica]